MSTQVRERVPKIEVRRSHLSRSRPNFSPIEIAVAVIVFLFFFAVLFYYFSTLRPAQNNLSQLEGQLARDTTSLMAGKGPDKAPPNSVTDALNSLASFKTQYLRARHQGQRALIDEINALVKKHKATLTTGLEMSVENTGQETEKKKSKSKNAQESLNVFPKLNINFTIAGQYENLHSFINDLERNKQYLVIKAINFTAAEETDGETGRKRGTNGSGLSLTVSLSAYFQP